MGPFFQLLRPKAGIILDFSSSLMLQINSQQILQSPYSENSQTPPSTTTFTVFQDLIISFWITVIIPITSLPVSTLAILSIATEDSVLNVGHLMSFLCSRPSVGSTITITKAPRATYKSWHELAPHDHFYHSLPHSLPHQARFHIRPWHQWFTLA